MSTLAYNAGGCRTNVKSTFLLIFTMPHYASAVFAVERCLSVCMSVHHMPVLCLNS